MLWVCLVARRSHTLSAPWRDRAAGAWSQPRGPVPCAGGPLTGFPMLGSVLHPQLIYVHMGAAPAFLFQVSFYPVSWVCLLGSKMELRTYVKGRVCHCWNFKSGGITTHPSGPQMSLNKAQCCEHCCLTHMKRSLGFSLTD